MTKTWLITGGSRGFGRELRAGPEGPGQNRGPGYRPRQEPIVPGERGRPKATRQVTATSGLTPP